MVSRRCYRGKPISHEVYRVLPSFTEFYRVVLSFSVGNERRQTRKSEAKTKKKIEKSCFFFIFFLAFHPQTDEPETWQMHEEWWWSMGIKFVFFFQWLAPRFLSPLPGLLCFVSFFVLFCFFLNIFQFLFFFLFLFPPPFLELGRVIANKWRNPVKLGKHRMRTRETQLKALAKSASKNNQVKLGKTR